MHSKLFQILPNFNPFLQNFNAPEWGTLGLASSKMYIDFWVKSENLKNLIYLHLKNFQIKV